MHIHAVKVFVRDQDQSLRFYVDQLGFEVAFDARLHSGDRWVAVAPPDGTAVITLIAPDLNSREYALIGRSTGIILVTENVALTYAEWRRRGVRFRFAPRLRPVTYDRGEVVARSDAQFPLESERPSVWGGVFTQFRDPDGNSFDLVGFDEVSREVEAQRRAATEKLDLERRATQELEIAKQVQARLFPQRLPPIKTLEYTGTCIQARQVGGDYYDFLDLGQERFALVLGDISGKGIAAALLMANLQANLRSQCAIASDDPQRTLQSVNHLFYGNTADSSFATLFFAEYDDRAQRLRYANCGHLPVVLMRSDGTVEKLHATCPVLGLFGEWDCSIAEARLFSGDTLVLYTDGVTESFNEISGEEFGEERLIEALRQYRDVPLDALIGSIVEDVRRFSPGEQYDDITLIVARCRENGAGNHSFNR